MRRDIAIVDRGRGPQLSTTRITVQDLVPYFQGGCSYEEIIRWIPTLTPEEIQVVERYYKEHKEEVLEVDRRIRERNAERRNAPEVEQILREGRAERQAMAEEFRRRKANGDGQ